MWAICRSELGKNFPQYMDHTFRALYPSKLDIGYYQKAGDIANLKSGYWILPTENRILGY